MGARLQASDRFLISSVGDIICLSSTISEWRLPLMPVDGRYGWLQVASAVNMSFEFLFVSCYSFGGSDGVLTSHEFSTFSIMRSISSIAFTNFSPSSRTLTVTL